MRCRLCGRPLRSEESIRERIGPGCKKKIMTVQKNDYVDNAEDIQSYLDYLQEENEVSRCDKCGKKIRFIKREKDKALVVNAKPYYFVPHPFGRESFVTSHGDIRKGEKVEDGIQGFKLHHC